MNLSPDWVAVLERHGWEVVHWSNVGDPRATDSQIMAWANATGHVVFTHDLGFGALLAAGGDQAPSVIQVRTQDVTPGHLEPLVVAALRDHEVALNEGALVSVDESRREKNARLIATPLSLLTANTVARLGRWTLN